jgi:hypothetical protein
MLPKVTENQQRRAILHRRPIFCAVFLMGLCIVIYIFGQSFSSSIIGLSYWILPIGPFPDVSNYDAASVIEAMKIVFRFITQGGSFDDPKIASSGRHLTMFRASQFILASSLCFLCVLFSRGYLLALAIFVGGLLILFVALFHIGLALLAPHGSVSEDIVALVAIAYIGIGGYSIAVSVKEFNYARCG